MIFRVATLVAFVFSAMSVAAQDRRPSHCIAIADAAPGIEYLHKASFRDGLDPFTVRITYINHATFLIQTPDGKAAATDYTGFLGTVDFVPDVVTMNNAHSSHWTAIPDPRIPHVLEGWAQDGVAADHSVLVGEMLVRNVPTDVRSGFEGVREDGNSIFVFEVEGLCIGHLGHLHHEPDEAQYAALGRVDVVMAAVDGGLTVDIQTMVRILKRLRSSVVLPMHAWSAASMQEFLVGMSDDFAIERGGTSIEVSLRTLPSRPTVVVLRPGFLRDEIGTP